MVVASADAAADFVGNRILIAAGDRKMKATTIKWDGKQITKPGLYSAIPLELYHAGNICDGPSVSSSGLRRIFNESPAHFYDEWSGNPDRAEQDDKPHFTLGRAVHHLMLGEPFFAKLFALQPETYVADRGPDKGQEKPWSNNSAVCRGWHDQVAKSGRAVITGKDVENIKGMARSLGGHPMYRAGALDGMIERSIFWKDKDTGIWLKSRPDAIPNDSGDFTDLKTTTSVKWFDLQRTIADMAYYQQGALVRRAAREVLGISNPTFTLIFVEKERPWCVRVVQLKDADLDRGERANQEALNAMAECMKSGRWPGPGGEQGDGEHIEMTERAQTMIDDRLKYGIRL